MRYCGRCEVNPFNINLYFHTISVSAVDSQPELAEPGGFSRDAVELRERCGEALKS